MLLLLLLLLLLLMLLRVGLKRNRCEQAVLVEVLSVRMTPGVLVVHPRGGILELRVLSLDLDLDLVLILILV